MDRQKVVTSRTVTIEEVLALSWAALNRALLKCDDEVELQCWVAAATADGRKTRIKRIYGRLSAVRRAKELEALMIHTSKTLVHVCRACGAQVDQHNLEVHDTWHRTLDDELQRLFHPKE